MAKRERRDTIYEMLMLCLCTFALLVLVVDSFGVFPIEASMVLLYADTTICFFFMFDFLFKLLTAESKWRYLRTWGWIDFVSSIPLVDTLRWGRLVRVLRVVRLLRGFHTAMELSKYVARNRTQSSFASASLISFLLVFLSSVAILLVETTPDAKIQTAGDAMWWSLTTMTTVGYGDLVPVTTWGRLVGAILMLGGIGLFGVFTAVVASWFLEPVEREQEIELAALREQLTRIEEHLNDASSG